MQKKWLTKISAHGLRHLCATILLEQNVPLEEISHILGHASVSTTFDIYCVKFKAGIIFWISYPATLILLLILQERQGEAMNKNQKQIYSSTL